ncbi:histidinol dehydrogenase, partial [Gluconobacter japonicus]
MKRLNTLNAGFENDFASLMADRSSEERSVAEPVRAILADVRARGDEALCDYTARFDRLTLPADKLRISAKEIAREADRVPADLMESLKTAARRIEAFHAAQMPKDLDFTDDEGIRLGMRWTALDAVGLYVPGGKAAYPSSVLMNALPARVAGVQRVAMCVPSP